MDTLTQSAPPASTTIAKTAREKALIILENEGKFKENHDLFLLGYAMGCRMALEYVALSVELRDLSFLDDAVTLALDDKDDE